MQKRVLITGAGSGIGKEFVKLFLDDGSHVLGVSLLDEVSSITPASPVSASRSNSLQNESPRCWP
jgi:NAD(P)-dependent dehydrogenase (short-subunit alcohol dehydrogenase family)